MKNLQIQEKLFVYNERFAEAHQIRNELSLVEVSEQNRVENKIIDQQDKKKARLIRKHQTELNQLQQKNKENHNKLLINFEREKDRLEKEIKLHYHDITKNQNLASKLAVKQGKCRDELRRIKQNAKNLQMFIKAMKNNKVIKPTTEKIFKSQSSFKLKPSIMKHSLTLESLKLRSPKYLSPVYYSPKIGYNAFDINTQVLTRFNIKSELGNLDTPRSTFQDNFSSNSPRSDKHYQLPRNDNHVMRSLASLYDNKLEPIE